MKTKQKLPIADGRWLLKKQRAIVFPGSIVNRKSQIVNVWAFTLIELLVVIGVIAVLAALILPVASAVKKKAFIQTAQAQMAQLETAIDRYKSTYGFYPPAGPNGPLTNQLYYELEGTIRTNVSGVDSYVTLDHSAQIPVSSLSSVFGTGVGGFMNCNKPGGDESVQQAQNFLPELNTNQVNTVTVGATPVKLLVTPSGGPDLGYNPLGSLPADHLGVNPWRYNSANPNHNSGSYDLWIQLLIAGNTNLICNWSKQVQINNGSVP
jgi:prepilin-type N-terminal cleavage/methylation domain-containing protein